ncbi:hypothetical protein BME24068_04300 [Burkholderia metallica]|nr:hypothetical protein BME24068_04300 [Burkholderia metallica]
MIDDPPARTLTAVNKKRHASVPFPVRAVTNAQAGFAGLSCIDLYSRYSSSPYTPFSRP